MDKLRTDLKLIRQVQSGEVAYIVKDPVVLKYYRFPEVAAKVFRFLDGTRTHNEVGELVSAEMNEHIPGSEIASFVESLKKLNFIEQSASEKSLLLLERLRKNRQLKAEDAAERGDDMYLRFPLMDPDRLYDRIIKHIWFIWTRGFLFFSFVLFSFAAAILIANWETVQIGLSQLWNFSDKGLRDIVTFIVVLSLVIILHENGHGLTCKRYGGEVHELGFMLIYFMPAFYCNVSDAWTFDSKAAKLWVTFAGAYVELVICSIATFVWYLSAPGYFAHDLAFTFMLVAGLSSIAINMNPLIKLDGYFALVDYLEIPNLAEDSSRYVTSLIGKHVFRLPIAVPDYKPRLKRIFLIYGVLSFSYKVFITLIMLFFFFRIVSFFFPENNILVFPLVAFRLLKKRLRAPVNGLRFLYQDKKELFKKRTSLLLITAIAAVILGLFSFLPLPYSHRANFIVEPVETIAVRAASQGFLATILAKEGDSVPRGALLALLRDRDLEEKRDSLKAQIAIQNRSIVAQRAGGAIAESLVAERRRMQLTQQLSDVESQITRLNLVAPEEGVVITPRVDEKLGRFLKEGEEFCELARSGALRARIRVDDWDLQEVAVGWPAKLWLNAGQNKVLSGQLTKLAPASELHQRLSPAFRIDGTKGSPPDPSQVKATNAAKLTPRVKRPGREQAEALTDEATSAFEAPLTRFEGLISIAGDPTIKPGMSGEAKIYGPRRPLAVIAWRSFRDWFRSRVWW